ncbi:nucleoid-associated protein [Clostridium botulinum]|uniref:nucleoid-associated protein n=1 Tax=Clostridium botulinum TaxID=1491 RepID=UPI0007731246|nr:nucleoid-associated protein [Clostridium botulinum]NFH81713.1 nucleoid-associated protein [Clostridium botulinum]NFH84950.1 nucleoid-associated protein [Clostridium botulinum]NFI12952.1 nucleoid-associated protein [Clostridium botulinum]NFI16113.1 nucleoid-associated protein [Clostridium botulinum]NFO85953.1 nucleoid-associated protein [Clostridium botulinum]
MEYINDIDINQAVIHVLDRNAAEPVLNEYMLELNDEVYKFLYKHIEKCLKDDELKYAKFKQGTNLVKETVKDYLNGIDDDFIRLSKSLAKQLFAIIQIDESIDSCDLIIVSIITDQGPMIGILKLDYVKNFTHEIQFIDEKIGVGIVQQTAGLPGNGQKIEKAAFIKPFREDDLFNLYVLDKKRRTKEDTELGINYFLSDYLYSSIVTNERDMTKEFIQASENFVRRAIVNDAVLAEKVRSKIKDKLKDNDVINLGELSKELFENDNNLKESFTIDLKMKALDEEIVVDSKYIEKKLKRIRLNIDKQIDLYINEGAYHDSSKFEVQRNGDGSINLVIKNVINYIEK